MTRPTPLTLAALLLALALVACGGGTTGDPAAPPVPTAPPESFGWFCVAPAQSTRHDAAPVCVSLPPTPEVAAETTP